MASASSVIRISIIGDTKGLDKSLSTAQGKIGGFAKGALGALAGVAVIDKAFDFAQSSLAKADAFGDALDRISGTVSPEFASRINDVAFDLTNFGLSADEVGTLAAHFADLATSAGATKDVLALATPDLLKVAAGVAATTGKTVDEVVDDIGKAVKGTVKPIAEYGVVLDKSLSPDQTIISILDQLKEKFPDAAEATNDYAGKQEALNAKWDNFSIKVGEALDGPLQGVLDFMITMIDRDVPKLADQIGDLGEDFGQMADAGLAAFDNLMKGLRALNDFAGEVGRNIGGALGIGSVQASGDREVTFAQRREAERNGQSRIGRDNT